jgi:hypothetical protein
MSIRFTSIRPTAADVARSMRDANQAAVCHSYFVVMIDYGRKGCEAIVDPEITRREVVARIVSGEYRDIVFIHEIADGAVTDVTLELQIEASQIAEAA